MASKPRDKHERVTRKKSPNMKRRIQRTFSWSVLSSHLSVKVYDSHANMCSTSVRGNGPREKLEKKFSLQESRNRYAESRNNSLPTGEWNSENDSSTNKMLRASFDRILPADGDSSDKLNLLAYKSSDYGLGSPTDHMQNATHEVNSTGNGPMQYRDVFSGGKNTSPLSTERWISTRQRRRKYNALDPIAELKPECILDTVKMYKKYNKEAKRRKKLITDIQLQAKLRSSSNKLRSFNDPKIGLQRPRRLSPLRKKHRLPEAIEATKDNRFQKLLQSLATVNMS